MRAKTVVALLVLLVVAGSFFYLRGHAERIVAAYFNPANSDPIPFVTTREQPYTLLVATEGELTGLEVKPVLVPRVPRGSLRIAWLAKEGSIIEAGQPIVRFDNSEVILSLQQNENTVATYQSRISKSQEDARSQDEVYRIDYTGAELELGFAERQVRQDEEIFSRWEIEESVMSAALARYKKSNIETKSGLNRNLSDADLKILKIESGKAETEVRMSQQTLSSLEVVAPASGVVLYRRLGWNRMVEEGAEVWPGMTLMEIADIGKFQGKINVIENDIAGVEPGKKVQVTLLAFPTEVVTGTVTKVATAAQQLTNEDPRKYFTCDVLLDVSTEILERLKPGMKIRGDIEVGKRDNAIVLPRSALIKKGSESIVFVKTKDSYEERKVAILDGDYGFYLVDGLEHGEEVCLQHPFEKQKLRLPDFSAPTPATQGRRFTVVYR
jgi:HlyD family secretion protein